MDIEKLIQAYLILLCFTSLHFEDTIFFFYKRKVLGKPASSIYWCHFPHSFIFKLRYVYIFWHTAIAHLIDYSINITFTCTGKLKS